MLKHLVYLAAAVGVDLLRRVFPDRRESFETVWQAPMVKWSGCQESSRKHRKSSRYAGCHCVRWKLMQAHVDPVPSRMSWSPSTLYVFCSILCRLFLKLVISPSSLLPGVYRRKLRKPRPSGGRHRGRGSSTYCTPAPT